MGIGLVRSLVPTASRQSADILAQLPLKDDTFEAIIEVIVG